MSFDSNSIDPKYYKLGRYNVDKCPDKSQSNLFGHDGLPLLIRSNHFKVSFDPLKYIYQYMVVIEDNIGVHNVNRKLASSNEQQQQQRMLIGNLFKEHFPSLQHCYVYDGNMNLFTTDRIPFDQQAGEDGVGNFELTGSTNNSHTFMIQLKQTDIICFEWLQQYYGKPPFNNQFSANNDDDEEVQFEEKILRPINLLIRQLNSQTRIQIGRNYFHNSQRNDANLKSISTFKEISFGIFSSIQTSSYGLQLIVDRCCTPFMKCTTTLDQCFIWFLKEHKMNGKWNDIIHKRLEEQLNGYFMEVVHQNGNRKYRISGITFESSKEVFFKPEQKDEQINVADYFEQTYYQLRHPEFPCVKVKNNWNNNVVNDVHFIYFPLEVCRLTSEQKCHRLTLKERSDLIRYSASICPQERFQVIEHSMAELIDNIHNNVDQLKLLESFGIRINEEPIKVKARVLNAPPLLQGDHQPVKVHNGKWRLRKFYKRINLNKWILVQMCPFQEKIVNRFLNILIRTGNEHGMNIELPWKINYSMAMMATNGPPQQLAANDLRNFFQQLCTEYSDNNNAGGDHVPIDLIYFAGCDNEHQYNIIKRIAEVEFHLATQCIRSSNVNRFNQSMAFNVLQKINTKLGGINVMIHLDNLPVDDRQLYKDCMVVGVDVAHPFITERSNKSNCSVAAMVATYDQSLIHYTSAIRSQSEPRQEIIKNLNEMLLECLQKYQQQNNGNVPNRIIVYRDGVSNGEFDPVYKEEIHMIKQSLHKYANNGGAQIKLTFIVVQKRHHTRFMPEPIVRLLGNSSNIPAGTVVDDQVVHPKHFDFYLCSHAGIQGTSKPSHYNVLIDENEMTADQIQQFTYNLCYLYARCSRSIAIPTPVYYAHLAAFRARAHIEQNNNDYYDKNNLNDFLTGIRFNRLQQDSKQQQQQHLDEILNTIITSDDIYEEDSFEEDFL